jgi:hypothetical protein
MGLDFSHINVRVVKKRKVIQPVLIPALNYLVWDALKENKCPVDGRRVYWKRDNSLIYCKKKDCTFRLPKNTYEDIVSGKRLNDYKEQRKVDLR